MKDKDVKPCSVFYIDSDGNKQCLNPPEQAKRFSFWLFKILAFIFTAVLITISVGGIL